MKTYSVSNRMKDLRERKNLKQFEIAEYLGTTQQNYSKYENGKIDLPIYHLGPLSKLYNVSTDYILGLTMSENDLHTIMTHAGKDNSKILEEIATLDLENIKLLLDFIEFLKFKQKGNYC
ncbi:HTH-type transcriptional regulator ImmR [Clostridiales bacterium]|nr:HTH-type transcriptional regulator ImmR [Clostridiales bacterium]